MGMAETMQLCQQKTPCTKPDISKQDILQSEKLQTRIADELNKFTESQRKIIYENLYAIELTEGCSIGCDFCGLDAKRGIGKAIPFSVLEKIAFEIPKLTNRITDWANKFSCKPKRMLLYDATDPLDYQQDGKNYFDAVALFTARGFSIGTSTAIPAGKEELAIANLDNIHQISISHMNRERLQPYFARLNVVIFVDLFHFYYAKFGKHDYSDKAPIKDMIVKVEETIEKTVRQLRKLDPSLPEKTRFYDLRIDGNRLREHVQDFKAICLFCGNNGQYSREGKIKDRDEGQVRNNGRAFNLGQFERWYPNDPLPPFYNSQGVKITPNGVFNIFSINPSSDNPSGIISEKVSPADFRVIKMDRPPYLANFPLMPSYGYVRCK
jgi:hypothetical protein